MLITKDVLVERIKEDWSNNKTCQDLCLELMEYLIDLSHEESLGCLPFGFLCVATEWKYKVEDTLLAMQYLCCDSVSLLEISFREENDKDIPKEKLREYDPEKVFLHFRPSKTCEMVGKMPNFISPSIRNGDYGYWQTQTTPLSEGISRDSLLGENLGLAMGCIRGDNVIYTLNKVN